jgi:hypothetical protein
MMKFVKDTIEFIYFLFNFIKNRSFKNNIKKNYSGTAAVLANGPSLKEVLLTISTKSEFKDVDFIVLNFFAFENTFFEIKPKHYCLADPMFFQETHKIDGVLKLYKILNENVNWNMNIYIPKHYLAKFKSFSKLKNKYISIFCYNNTRYDGFEIFRNYFYKNNLAIPPTQNVANLAIYLGINLGYSKLNLFGVDHTFFDSLCVNEKNEVCVRETHFYSDSKAILKPLRRNDNDEVFKMSDYIAAIQKMFKSHDLLNEYAKYKNVEIVNYTKQSLIDSYKRIGMIK